MYENLLAWIGALNENPLDLVEGDLVLSSVVEPGRPCAFMIGPLLSEC